jgi:hypothetical protein
MDQVFGIVPASSRVFWAVGLLALFLAGTLVLFGYFAYSSLHTRYVLSERGLEIRGTLYGRLVPASALLPGARLVDLRTNRQLAPRLRTNGIGLPGYRAGWFRLGNGEKALVFVTDPRRVVYVPTREGYALLLSPEQPERLLALLVARTAA